MTAERRERLWLIALLVVVGGIYARALTAAFTFDDYIAIRTHPGVVGAFSPREIFLRDYWGETFGSPALSGMYRPISTLSYWVDWHIGRGAPWSFHLTNVALYLAVCAQGWRLLARWGSEAMSAAARLSAIATFAVLAIHVDAVPSGVGRCELLALLFSLVAIELAARPDPTMGSVVAAIGATLLAQFSKESAVPLALVVAFFALRSGRRPFGVRTYAIVAGSLATLGVVFWVRQGRLGWMRAGSFTDNPLLPLSFSRRFPGAMEIFARYVGHAVAPIDLCPDYSYASDALSTTKGPAIVGVSIAVALLILGVLGMARRWPRVPEAIVAFGGAYVAVSHVVIPGSTAIADRLFFGPSFWLVVIGALALDRFVRGHRARAIGACAAVGSFCVGQATLTVLAVPLWHDQTSLARYGVNACPNDARLRFLRAFAAFETDDPIEGAWSTLVGIAIRRRFPGPTPEAMFPTDWDSLPVGDRLRALRARVGDVEMRGICAQSLARVARKKLIELGPPIRRLCDDSFGENQPQGSAPPRQQQEIDP